MLRTRFLLWIDLLDRVLHFDTIPTLELTLTRIIFRFRFYLLSFFVIACLTFVPVACFALWFPELCTSIRLFLIWLFYYRKRGSASYIVREVHSVREREREIQRERERRK